MRDANLCTVICQDQAKFMTWWKMIEMTKHFFLFQKVDEDRRSRSSSRLHQVPGWNYNHIQLWFINQSLFVLYQCSGFIQQFPMSQLIFIFSQNTMRRQKSQLRTSTMTLQITIARKRRRKSGAIVMVTLR